MKRKRLWIIFALLVVIALQGIAIPMSRDRFYVQNEYPDEDDDLDDEDDLLDAIPDSILATWSSDSLFKYSDSLLILAAADSDAVQDSIDNIIAMMEVPDSIQAPIDSFCRKAYLQDSIEKAKIAFQHWFDSLPKKEQRIWIRENVTLPAQMRKADSILAVKDSIQAYKDSVISATPRILETPFIPDSLYYKRILLMKWDKRFGDIKFEKLDTTYNRSFYDYPFFREDVNATWLGVASSPVQPYNYTKRTEEEDAIFFTPYRSWTYTPSTLPVYNTKTPYTELGYFGTPISGDKKEEINLRLLTTQNITPRSNITFELNKFGGQGLMMNGNTQGYHLALSGNYTGKRYAMHAGWIHSKTTRTENGGIIDNSMIRDTVVDSREIPVFLKQAENVVDKNTLFINQSLRIPFGSDSLTTAYVGHTTEWTVYKKFYSDQINDPYGRKLYHNQFYLIPNQSADTMRVMKLDNKLYLRLQPWKDDSAISKIDVGIGDKLLTYTDYISDSTFTGSRKTNLNNIYAYAGAKGMVKRYFNWDANAQFYFAGYKAGDFNVDANMNFNFYPFRRARQSPVSIGAHFRTDLEAPDHYQQHILLNHYKWDNSFGKQTRTKISGTIDIPYWKMDAEVAYSLLGNTIYYDSLGIVRQHADAMSVLSASLRKEFVAWKFHFDNRLLFQLSSNQDVVPVPMLAMNLRWYFQFNVVRNVMQMQIGANALFNTKWRMPGYNPNLGVFYNQNEDEYGLCPYIDAFVNIQWKRCCIFLKFENVNQGWPMHTYDYFTAHHYIHTQRGFKFGINWPFYVQPAHSHNHGHDHDHGHGHGH